MRSTSRTSAGQEALWDVPASPGTSTRRRPSPAGRLDSTASSGDPAPGPTWTVCNGDFARRGWHPGTVLHVEPATRAGRGDLVVVRDGERLLVGFFGLDRGRPALLTDAGSTWLADRSRVVGLVTAVEAPLTP